MAAGRLDAGQPLLSASTQWYSSPHLPLPTITTSSRGCYSPPITILMTSHPTTQTPSYPTRPITCPHTTPDHQPRPHLPHSPHHPLCYCCQLRTITLLRVPSRRHRLYPPPLRHCVFTLSLHLQCGGWWTWLCIHQPWFEPSLCCSSSCVS